MRELPIRSTTLLLSIALFLPLFSIAQSIVVSNPSACPIGFNIPDAGCDPNINVVPDPEEVWVNVSNAPGNQLGVDVFLREVQFIIQHAWANDLDITLTSPGGITVALTLDNGGGEDNYGDPNTPGCGAPVRLTMESCYYVTDAPAPFTDAPLRPEGSLFRFNDGTTNPNGQWILHICDDAQVHTGRLDYVNLIFAPITCLPVETVNVIQQDSNAVTINWSPFNSCGNSILEYGPTGFSPGAGAFAESMSRALQLSLKEFGEASLRSDKTIPMNAQCTVFAESEVVSLIHSSTPKEDIAKAVLDAVASRVCAMVRRVGIEDEVILIGGMVHNPGFVQSLKGALGVDKVLLPEMPEYISALGAALIAAENNKA